MKKYERVEMQVVNVSNLDVVRTSGGNELEWDMD